MRGGSAQASAVLPPRLGAIKPAASATLRDARQPVRPIEVHAEVERLLGRRVSQDTVGSFLSVAARHESSPVERLGRGCYVSV